MLQSDLSASDRFDIFEQLNLHQHCIDKDASLASAKKYVDLYWPAGKFTVRDLRTETFDGPEVLQQSPGAAVPVACW